MLGPPVSSGCLGQQSWKLRSSRKEFRLARGHGGNLVSELMAVWSPPPPKLATATGLKCHGLLTLQHLTPASSGSKTCDRLNPIAGFSSCAAENLPSDMKEAMAPEAPRHMPQMATRMVAAPVIQNTPMPLAECTVTW